MESLWRVSYAIARRALRTDVLCGSATIDNIKIASGQWLSNVKVTTQYYI